MTYLEILNILEKETRMAARMCAGMVVNDNLPEARRWAAAWDELNDLYTDELVAMATGRHRDVR